VHVGTPLLRLGLATSLVLGPSAAYGQAFLHWGQSPRALAMGGAAVGLGDDPTAALHSPAAIVGLAGTQLHVGGALGVRDGSFDAYDAQDADADLRLATTPTLYATHAIAERLVGGIAIATPWRAEHAWESPAEFVGRFRATDVELRGLLVNPVVAYQHAPGWALAVGVVVVDAALDLERFEQDPALSALGGGGPIELARGGYDLEGTSLGWNAAAYYRPSDDLAAGLQFRSGVDVDLHGRVDFDVVAPEELRRVVGPDGRPLGEQLDRTYVDQAARSRIEFPAMAILGVAGSPVPPLVLAADLQWANWDDVDELRLAAADSTLADRAALTYEDAWTVRLGAEAHPIEGLRVRVGFAREWSPAPLGAVSPIFPDADRSAVSVGAGYRWMDVDLDVGYRLTLLEDREGVAFPGNTGAADGRFEAIEHRFAIGATRRF
jgi:long-chain fatty acid transport protein